MEDEREEHNVEIRRDLTSGQLGPALGPMFYEDLTQAPRGSNSTRPQGPAPPHCAPPKPGPYPEVPAQEPGATSRVQGASSGRSERRGGQGITDARRRWSELDWPVGWSPVGREGGGPRSKVSFPAQTEL